MPVETHLTLHYKLGEIDTKMTHLTEKVDALILLTANVQDNKTAISNLKLQIAGIWFVLVATGATLLSFSKDVWSKLLS